MTESEQIAFDNGFILGIATKGLIKANIITKPYYTEPTLKDGIVMADRPLVGNDAELQLMIFNAKAGASTRRTYFFIAYGMWGTSGFPQGPQWVIHYSNLNTINCGTAPNQVSMRPNATDLVVPFKSDWTIRDGYYENRVWDASLNKLPYIAYSTINIIDSITSEIIMPAPYNLFG